MSPRLGRVLPFALMAAVWAALAVPAGANDRRRCDVFPTGVAYEDHLLPFTVPTGLMPDSRFDERAALLDVHPVRPPYNHGKCAWVPSRAAVLIHGRMLAGPPKT